MLCTEEVLMSSYALKTSESAAPYTFHDSFFPQLQQ